MDAGGKGPRYSATPGLCPTVGSKTGIAEYRGPLSRKKLLVSGGVGFPSLFISILDNGMSRSSPNQIFG